jgi:hypothetical protein
MVIKRSAEEVFDFVADERNEPRLRLMRVKDPWCQKLALTLFRRLQGDRDCGEIRS